jgi:peptidoglycan/xylan/chitin deacetylase (PgdA/CDA1 family)
VCNRRALEDGVPGLLALLEECGVRASFFVAFGPDNSGKAVRRVFRRGFVAKMLRTRAPRMYGVRTLLYGTLLPAPPVGEAFPGLLRSAEAAGHEVGLHGFDHVGWHDGLGRMGEDALRSSYAQAARLFEEGVGHPPRHSGAPGWQVTPASLRVQEELGLGFASDCRGEIPFNPRLEDRTLKTLQVPTTLPTSDEVLGIGGVDPRSLSGFYADRLSSERINVIGLHAEAEGLHLSGWLREFLGRMRGEGAAFPLLSEVAEGARGRAPAVGVEARCVPGRAGPVACAEELPGATGREAD